MFSFRSFGRSSPLSSNPVIFSSPILPKTSHFSIMAITGSSAAFSMTKSPQFSLFSAFSPRTQMVVSAAKATPEIWVASLRVKAKFGSPMGGASVLDRLPVVELPQTQKVAPPAPQLQQGGDMGQQTYKKGLRRGDAYRVLLIDDKRHTEQLVAKVVPQAVPSVTPDDARKLFHESKENGVAVVIIAVKEHAEFYAEMMIRGGLQSTIEP